MTLGLLSDISPNPSQEGFDIPPGYATAVGVTGEEVIRLPQPYSDCSNSNIEDINLFERIEKETNVNGSIITDKSEHNYRVIDCRSSCIQRYIWESCGCLDLNEKLPLFNMDLLCVHLGQKTELLYRLKNNEILDICMQNKTNSMLGFLKQIEKLVFEAKCVKRIKTSNVEMECKCPPPCLLRKYNLDLGVARWPAPGPETDEAYEKLVTNSVIPSFKKLNTTMGDLVMDYLSQWEKREEILQNFARVTVYMKSRAVQRIEEVEAYSEMDLISDMGKTIYFNLLRHYIK